VTIYSQSSLAHVTVYVDALCDYVGDYGEVEGHAKIGARIFHFETAGDVNPAFPLARTRASGYQSSILLIIYFLFFNNNFEKSQMSMTMRRPNAFWKLATFDFKSTLMVGSIFYYPG
jgi:hypothetical protein